MGGVRTLLIIPARYDSTRLPGKVLKLVRGKPILQHVWEKARRARSPDQVVVATDDGRIREACVRFGARCLMTSRRHTSGTSRCAEVARRLRADHIIHLQADEPEITPRMIDRVAKGLRRAPICTLAVPLADPRDFNNPNRVKVVLDREGNALYFSRAPVPYRGTGLLHVGIYGYHRSALLKLSTLRQTRLERDERLEQLRALAWGLPIRVEVMRANMPGGIDTPSDLARFRRARKG